MNHSPAINDAEDPQIVEDACEFQCQDCTEVLNSWDAMTDHQISSHSSSERRAMSPEDFVITKKLHPCCICGVELLQDNALILDHIVDKHNLTAKAYLRWLDVKAQVQKGTPEEENLQIDGQMVPVKDIKIEIDKDQGPGSEADEDEYDEIASHASEAALRLKQASDLVRKE